MVHRIMAIRFTSVDTSDIRMAHKLVNIKAYLGGELLLYSLNVSVVATWARDWRRLHNSKI